MTAQTATHSAARSWEVAARFGYAVSGVLHALIGLLALRLAFGDASKEADQSGALQTVAQTPFGAVVLWFAVVAFAALGAWQAAIALRRSPSGSSSGSSKGDRAKAAGRAVVYLALAVTSYAFATGGGSSSDQQTTDTTAKLMQAPGGRLLVGAVGVAIVVVGVYHVVKGLRQKFLRDLRSLPSGTTGTAVRWAGMVGYVAKGVALAIVGVLFVLAAQHANPQEAGGIDTALRTLEQQPAGDVLLVLVALGLIAFGVYSFVRARFGRV
jgi:succinate dehydrogenase/fumarate reductase cytochrome b subunit